MIVINLVKDELVMTGINHQLQFGMGLDCTGINEPYREYHHQLSYYDSCNF